MIYYFHGYNGGNKTPKNTNSKGETNMKPSRDYDMISRMYVIPQYQDNKEFLLCVDRATKEMVHRRFSLFLEYDWECNTVATVVLKTLCSVLYMNITGAVSDILNIVEEDEEHDKYISFCGLLRIQPSHRRNEKAEKVGSINCKFTPGYRVREIIEDDTEPGTPIQKVKVSEYYLTGDEHIDHAWDKFDEVVRTELANKYGIIIKDHYATIGVAECFLECLYCKMILDLKLEPDVTSISTIVNDYFEISGLAMTNPDGSIGVKFTMTPGKYSKLTIKSDVTTESEED